MFANLRFGARPARGNGDGEHAGEGEGEREGVQTDEELTPVSWGSSETAGAAGGGRIELGGLGRVRTVSRTIPSASGLPARFHVRGGRGGCGGVDGGFVSLRGSSKRRGIGGNGDASAVAARGGYGLLSIRKSGGTRRREECGAVGHRRGGGALVHQATPWCGTGGGAARRRADRARPCSVATGEKEMKFSYEPPGSNYLITERSRSYFSDLIKAPKPFYKIYKNSGGLPLTGRGFTKSLAPK